MHEVDSILLRSVEPTDVVLPDGWAVDFIDGEPTAGWAASLHARMRVEGWS